MDNSLAAVGPITIVTFVALGDTSRHRQRSCSGNEGEEHARDLIEQHGICTEQCWVASRYCSREVRKR